MKDFKNLTFIELSGILASFNKPAYLSKNIYTWVYKRGITDFNLMTDISKNIREHFVNNYSISFLNVLKKETSTDGTVKFLFELEDKNTIESVLIPHDSRVTLCISSQVGCKMGCTFCNTAKQDFTRNLTVAEIVNQIHTANHVAVNTLNYKTDDSKIRAITNIVFMGMGEPLDNMENVINAIEVVANDNAFGFGKRKITVSTCGLAEEMLIFKKKSMAKLALSLNAVNDELRSKIMPINKKYNISDLINTIDNIILKPHDFITIEYILFKGLNDSKEDAYKLASLLENLKIKVNLLYYNPHSKKDKFQSPSHDSIFAFNEILNSKAVISRVRESRGKDINAACGQLKSAYTGELC